jgi:hypothetical protein
MQPTPATAVALRRLDLSEEDPTVSGDERRHEDTRPEVVGDERRDYDPETQSADEEQAQSEPGSAVIDDRIAEAKRKAEELAEREKA